MRFESYEQCTGLPNYARERLFEVALMSSPCRLVGTAPVPPECSDPVLLGHSDNKQIVDKVDRLPAAASAARISGLGLGQLRREPVGPEGPSRDRGCPPGSPPACSRTSAPRARTRLVPAQTGSGGRVRLLGISKRGDTYLRTLLIHGARSVLMHAKEPGKWLQEIGKRRPPNVVMVAMANKMARTIWALLAHSREYDKGYVSVRPM